MANPSTTESLWPKATEIGLFDGVLRLFGFFLEIAGRLDRM
jgi:hypothetical protein